MKRIPETVLDPAKFYTTTQIIELARLGYAPFRSLSTLHSIIHSGKLKVVVRGTSKKKKYYIQGKELVVFAEGQNVSVKNANAK